MFRSTSIIFKQSYSSTLLKLQKSIVLETQQYQYTKLLTYVIVTVYDKIQSIKRCELSAVIQGEHKVFP